MVIQTIVKRLYNLKITLKKPYINIFIFRF
jgi:hypothetical protein